jgi:hypothetical protein
MAGFSSLDDLVNNITVNGKFWRADWNKNHATAGTVIAGTWQCLAGGAGNPPVNSALGSGVTKVWKPQYDFLAAAGGIQHGGFVDATNATGFKTILNASAFSGAATSAPCVFMLVDLLAYVTFTAATIATAGTYVVAGTEAVTFDDGTGYLRMTTAADYDTYTPVRFTTAGALPTGLAIDTTYWTIRVSATTSKLALTLPAAIAGTPVTYTNNGTPTNTMWCWLPRYGTGAGVQAFTVNTTAFATAGASNLSITYKNSAGTAARVTPSAPALPQTTTVTPLLGITYSGTAAGKYGPFMPLQAPDSGIQYITNLISSVNLTNGVLALCLCKPLLTLPITTIGVAAERDLVNQLPSMPRVYDGACLTWLVYTQAVIPNNTAYYGHLDFGWS